MSAHRAVIRQAFLDAIPLYVPAVPFALVIGLAIDTSGINPVIGWSSSWLIFGGAAQLTLISLLGAGTAIIAAISAALVVNARHIMYSAALVPYFQGQPRWMQWLGPYLLIDQVFALASLRRYDEPDVFRAYYLAVGATFWILWQVTTALGILIGPAVPAAWRLEFAVPILFLGLVVMGIDKHPKLVAALVGASVTFLFAGLPNRAGLLVGAVAGIIVGTIAERYRR
ncbi:MAG: AzlC family ABC transporter permease [Gammaproteobacteria bacterium]|nr:AzlC family ABC transporter permease [Gammaproteobacteria bacterium]